MAAVVAFDLMHAVEIILQLLHKATCVTQQPFPLN